MREYLTLFIINTYFLHRLNISYLRLQPPQVFLHRSRTIFFVLHSLTRLLQSSDSSTHSFSAVGRNYVT